MDEIVQEIVSELKNLYRENLAAILLYGSATRGEHITGKSDTNFLIVLNRVTLDSIAAAEEILAKSRGKIKVNPVFWSVEELRNSVDIFPVEFLDIVRHHQVLYGENPLAGLSVDTKNIRHQLEFELRIKLLRLRSAWPNIKKSAADMESFLGKSGTSFFYLYGLAKKMKEGSYPPHIEEAFAACQKLKRGEIKLDRAELEKLYFNLHEAVQNLVKIIDSIQWFKEGGFNE